MFLLFTEKNATPARNRQPLGEPTGYPLYNLNMNKRPARIGLIGYQFMGKAHSNAYRQVGRFFDLPVEVELHTICGRNEAGVARAAETLGWKQYKTDWREVVNDPEIDIIDVSTPGDSHAEIAIAAAKAGKAVFCEKPLANTLAEAKAMLAAVEEAGVNHALFHNYRKAPAVAMIKRMIDEGQLGTLYHFRAVYLQDWIANPEFPLVWRLQKERAGSGTLGDIGSHILDLGRFLIGELSEVCGTTRTFIKQRPLAGEIGDSLDAKTAGGMGEVTVDDATAFLAYFQNGAMGSFEATRFAVGRKNHNRFEINGSRGSVVFNMERMNEFEYYNNDDPEGLRGFRLVQATDGKHPYAGNYWPVGHIIGYEHTFINLIYDALLAWSKGENTNANFYDGVKNQTVLDAIEKSAIERRWLTLDND